jgi:hypothetical protein
LLSVKEGHAVLFLHLIRDDQGQSPATGVTAMSEMDKERLSACCEAVRELSGQLMDDGHAQRDVVNALLCELLAFNCDTPADVERYLNGLLERFRRNRATIDEAFGQRAVH